MQIHPAASQPQPRPVRTLRPRQGADILRTDYVHGLKPLLDRFGNEPRFRLVLFTLDEHLLARTRAAGRALALPVPGPAWWFHDCPRACGASASRRWAPPASTTPSASTTTPAFLSIPARHDVARRIDCAVLAKRWPNIASEDEAVEVAADLAYRLPKEAYR